LQPATLCAGQHYQCTNTANGKRIKSAAPSQHALIFLGKRGRRSAGRQVHVALPKNLGRRRRVFVLLSLVCAAFVSAGAGNEERSAATETATISPSYCAAGTDAAQLSLPVPHCLDRQLTAHAAALATEGNVPKRAQVPRTAMRTRASSYFFSSTAAHR
jgi:hypothetical protein